ncbi:hypothetical protein ADL29_29830 [Streptomyces chattanoogensis]|uniref:Transposase n=1 Tax=Streptomyces chattanoogensis TaxID=66876 RepID=A0A0N0GWT6_9ACTN|nr:hypothetical protein ADL29_29830 [Streptomyces chattanoogensis]
MEPFLPDRTPRRSSRGAIAWTYQTGAQRRRPPPEYGSSNGVYARLHNWAVHGTWQRRAFTASVSRADAEDELEPIHAVGAWSCSSPRVSQATPRTSRC